LPPGVQEALGELAKERLLALSVGVGLGARRSHEGRCGSRKLRQGWHIFCGSVK